VSGFWDEFITAVGDGTKQLKLAFRTSENPKALEEKARAAFGGADLGVARLRNRWAPNSGNGLLEIELEAGGYVAGVWVSGDADKLLRVAPLEPGDVEEMLDAMDSSNIDGGVMRLYSYDWFPDG